MIEDDSDVSVRTTTANPIRWARDLYASQIGKKAVMAVSGIILFGYVFFHMLGNLKLYLGPRAINTYAEGLRDFGEPFTPRTFVLWCARTILIAAFFTHILAAAQLTIANRRARPVRYSNRTDYLAANYASRTMRWTGIIILLFVVFHLMNLTWGNVHPGGTYVRGDVYDNVVESFRVWYISLIYIAANLALGLHLYHGLWSLFQSLGWNNPRFNRWRNTFAATFALVVAAGNISFPLMVAAGVVR